MIQPRSVGEYWNESVAIINAAVAKSRLPEFRDYYSEDGKGRADIEWLFDEMDAMLRGIRNETVKHLWLEISDELRRDTLAQLPSQHHCQHQLN